jgi:hypothetical protein
VFFPDQPFAPGTSYEIQLDAARIRARSGGQPLAGPASFTFTTEDLVVLRAIDCPAVSVGACLLGDTLQFPEAGADPIGPNQALEYQFNANVTAASLPLIEVRDANNAPVSIAVIPHIDDPAECPVSSTRLVNVYPADPITGSPTRWAPGSYRLVIPGGASGLQAADGAARLATTTTVDFTVGPTDAPSDAPFLTSDLVTCP